MTTIENWGLNGVDFHLVLVVEHATNFVKKRDLFARITHDSRNIYVSSYSRILLLNLAICR